MTSLHSDVFRRKWITPLQKGTVHLRHAVMTELRPMHDVNEMQHILGVLLTKFENECQSTDSAKQTQFMNRTWSIEDVMLTLYIERCQSTDNAKQVKLSRGTPNTGDVMPMQSVGRSVSTEGVTQTQFMNETWSTEDVTLTSSIESILQGKQCAGSP